MVKHNKGTVSDSKDTGSDKNDQSVQHIALVSNSAQVSFDDTKQIAAALQKQLDNDFAGKWHINATIEAFNLAAVAPEEYRLIEILDNIGEDANGFHRKNKAFVAASADLSQVSRTCSHELLEMLKNPFNKLSKVSIPPADPNLPPELRADEPVKYLMEICDPCQSDRDSYEIDGITVCDFCLPNYYNRTNGPAFFRNDGRSREVRPGGCVTFRKEADQTWWQTNKFGDRLRTTRTTIPEALQADQGTVETANAVLLQEALRHRAKSWNGRSKANKAKKRRQAKVRPEH